MPRTLFITANSPLYGSGQGKYVGNLSKYFLGSIILAGNGPHYNSQIVDIKFKGNNVIIFGFLAFVNFCKNKFYASYDLLHSQGIDGFFIFLLPKSHRKYITTIQNGYLQRISINSWFYVFVGLPLFMLEFIVCMRSDKIICVSPQTASFVPFFKNKIHIIPNGFDFDLLPARNVSTEVFTFFYAGRFVKRKNILFVLESYKFFLSKNPFLNTRFVIIGEGPEKESIISYIRENVLENYVQIKPYTTNIYHDIATFDCLLLLSSGEGLPLILLETLAIGCQAIVSYDSSGQSSFILEHPNCIVMPYDRMDIKTTSSKMQEVFYRKGCPSTGFIPDWKDISQDIQNLF